MKIGDEDVGEGESPDEVKLKLLSAKKGKTSYDDKTLWLEFETENGKTFSSSYPFGRGGQGKLASFLKGARELLDLEKKEEVDIDEFVDRWVVYRRVEREFEGSDGETVSYWYYVPRRFVDGENGDSWAKEAAKKVEDYGEKEQELIDKLKSGLSRDDIYEAGKGAGMSDGEIDLFMMKETKKTGNIVQDGDKYLWKE